MCSDGERPALTLDRAELIAEHEGFTDPIGRDYGGGHHVRVQPYAGWKNAADGSWEAGCTDCWSGVRLYPDRGSAVAAAEGHNEGNCWVSVAGEGMR